MDLAIEDEHSSTEDIVIIHDTQYVALSYYNDLDFVGLWGLLKSWGI